MRRALVPDADVKPSAPTTAWIVAFGPIGASSDGYLIRAETNANALASLGFEVRVLEVASRNVIANPWPHVTTYPAFPAIVPHTRILGPLDPIGDLRGQIALAIGLTRHAWRIRESDLVVVEGGLLALAFILKLLRRRYRPIFVFDVITLMSELHRDRPGQRCNWQCRLRRRVWRFLERVCSSAADISIAGNAKEVEALPNGERRTVQHVVPTKQASSTSAEDPELVGFLGNGTIGPNREAVEFITSRVLKHPGLTSVRCRVIGDPVGYERYGSNRLELVGLAKDPAEMLAEVSVCCAPMRETGGVSTKVLTSLMHGKRTVCTPEAARGISVPPYGLWVAEFPVLAESVVIALGAEWRQDQADALVEWMSRHHGLGALTTAWKDALRSLPFSNAVWRG